MAEEVAALTVRLEATQARFERDMRRAENAFARSSRQIERRADDVDSRVNRIGARFASLIGPRIAAGLAAFASGAAFRGIVNNTEQIAKRLDDIGKTADKLGLTTDALQELRAAGEDSGIAMQTTDMALQRFTRRLAEARQGTGAAVDALEEMGIALVDANGQARSNEDILNDVADAMAGIQDPAERVRLAFKLFDSEGVSFVNLLREGSQALDDMRESARQNGEVVDESLIRKSEEAVTAIGRLQRKIDTDLANAFGTTQPLMIAWYETISTVTGYVRDLTAELDRASGAKQRFDDAIGARAATRALPAAEADLSAAQASLSEAQARLDTAVAEGRGEALILRYERSLDRARDRVAEAYAELDRLRSEAGFSGGPSSRGGPRGSRAVVPEKLPGITVEDSPLPPPRGGVPPNDPRSGGASPRNTDVFRSAVEYAEERIAALGLERRAVGLAVAEQARLRAEYEAQRLQKDLLAKAQEDGTAVTAEEASVISALVEQYRMLSLTTIEAREHQEAMVEAQRASERAAEEQARAIEQLGNRFASAIQQADSFADALKNVGIELLNLMAQGLGGTGPLAGVLGKVIPSLFSPTLSNSGNAFGPSGSLFTSSGAIALPNATGNAFANGRVIPFARGGVVTSPTNFPMAGGNIGLMGEAGPEAILPLKRGPGGKLGVAGGGASIVTNINIEGSADENTIRMLRAELDQRDARILRASGAAAANSASRSPTMRRSFGGR